MMFFKSFRNKQFANPGEKVFNIMILLSVTAATTLEFFLLTYRLLIIIKPLCSQTLNETEAEAAIQAKDNSVLRGKTFSPRLPPGECIQSVGRTCTCTRELKILNL